MLYNKTRIYFEKKKPVEYLGLSTNVLLNCKKKMFRCCTMHIIEPVLSHFKLSKLVKSVLVYY